MGSTRSSSPPRGRRPDPAPDVFLLPAVIGQGRGDVEEVLTLGRRLERLGVPLFLPRAPGQRLPRGVDATFAWPRVRRSLAPRTRAARALTVSAQFGLSAEGRRAVPLGAPGPWAPEREAIERRYGPANVLHISLEEFGRARPLRWLAQERWRESGRSGPSDPTEFRSLYADYRRLERDDLLALFPGFLPSRGFASEFPRSVQCGPLRPWPPLPRWHPGAHDPGRTRRIVGYGAGPGRETLVAGIQEGLRELPVRCELEWRAGSGGRPAVSGPQVPGHRAFAPDGRWERDRARADLWIVTGSRSLLEALDAGAPFLYWNGLLGSGRRRRRHRPEKLLGLLSWLRRVGVPGTVRHDLAEFSRGRAVPRIVRRALVDPLWRSSFGPRQPGAAYPDGFQEAGALVDRVVRRWSEPATGRERLIEELRRASRTLPRRSKI